MMTPVERENAQLAEVLADLSRATSHTLDPSAVLERAMTVLDRVVASGAASLWVDSGHGLERVATRQVPEDDDADATSDGDVVVALEGIERTHGRLVVSPAPGRSFSPGDRALLEIAGSQIAGALERARLYTEVMELERLKSDFIARVSHELRTPITIINGFLETLLTHGSDLPPDQQQHMLRRSQLASSRLGRLIEELLILSRIDAGVLTPSHGVVDVAELLTAVRDAATEPEQVLVSSPPGAELRTDADLLGRALGLLVDNAIKYGGIAEVRASREGDSWSFEVRDRGAGFADDVRSAAFEMFTRANDTSSIPGLGVGLPIARTIVEVLDGSITIGEVSDGGGALVRVTVPDA